MGIIDSMKEAFLNIAKDEEQRAALDTVLVWMMKLDEDVKELRQMANLMQARLRRLESGSFRRRLDKARGGLAGPGPEDSLLIQLAAATAAAGSIEEKVGNELGAAALRNWFESFVKEDMDRPTAAHELRALPLEGGDPVELLNLLLDSSRVLK